MKVDELGCLVMESSSPDGNLGDSCAESARLAHMQMHLGQPINISIFNFRTPIGYVRHPNSIWREDDFSSDQALPLFLAFKTAEDINSLKNFSTEMIARIKRAGWRTGNGDFVAPGFYALLKDSRWLINQTLCAQALIFKFPWRWDDGKKWFAKSSGSSCDYLNWIHAAIYADPWVRNMVLKAVLKAKVEGYYKSEPNSDWVVATYNQFIDKFF